ncbi:MAG: arsenosugar biosynthesis radical SAM protein ArsS [Mariprofundaceae bacterium]|nr:arsenosugar biosynthesis radical SAM protein ArsS [Mariprofundaceae bacterium]
MLNTFEKLKSISFPKVMKKDIDTLQVNLGYRCNQRCVHCHVNAGPTRKEEMSADVIELLLQTLAKRKIKVLDLTGGAPEMHPQFCYLVKKARQLGVHVIDRCNLSILLEDGYKHMAEFMAQHQVEVVASLPCYLEENVDKQRGDGIFIKSISALQILNTLGYGRDEDLKLNLVYNPQGAQLPPAQAELEASYKDILKERYDIDFHQLFTITNVPIQRFGSTLLSQNKFNAYMDLLQKSFVAENLHHLMCRSLLSVDWQGYLYDCDFNQMLDLAIENKNKTKKHLRDIVNSDLDHNSVRVLGHCYACTAGQGSSCGGAL